MFRGCETYSCVVVAGRLPVERRGGPRSSSPDRWASALARVVRERQGAWVGWPGVCDEEIDPFDAHGVSFFPIALQAAEFAAYYEGFCGAALWPLYHDQVVVSQFCNDWWESYREVNERFAEAVIKLAAPGAIVWIHDFELQLVPNLVKCRRPDVVIGYFSDIPFPAADLYSRLPWREEILTGILGADVIGFQRDSDVANFAAAVDRISPVGPDCGGRIVRKYPSSVDAEAVTKAATSAAVVQDAAAVRRGLGSPDALFLGVDRLDHTQGILERLYAFEGLLEEGHLDPNSTRFIQVALPAEEGIGASQELRDDVEQTIGRINGRFAAVSGAVVHYVHRPYSFEATVALYLAADVLLVTSVREGMSSVAKEYAVARRGRGGVLVLSEFSGAADELTRAVLVNPFDQSRLKAGMVRAVRMGCAESESRMNAMAEVVAGYDIHDWAKRFLDDLERCAIERVQPALNCRLNGKSGLSSPVGGRRFSSQVEASAKSRSMS